MEAPYTWGLESGGIALVRWCVENRALAQLLSWRPVPGFQPSADVFAASAEQMTLVRAEFGAAVSAGQLTPAADSDTAVRLWTVLISGLIGQQIANEPGESFETGRFTSLSQEALDMLFERYRTHQIGR